MSDLTPITLYNYIWESEFLLLKGVFVRILVYDSAEDIWNIYLNLFMTRFFLFSMYQLKTVENDFCYDRPT